MNPLAHPLPNAPFATWYYYFNSKKSKNKGVQAKISSQHPWFNIAQQGLNTYKGRHSAQYQQLTPFPLDHTLCLEINLLTINPKHVLRKQEKRSVLDQNQPTNDKIYHETGKNKHRTRLRFSSKTAVLFLNLYKISSGNRMPRSLLVGIRTIFFGVKSYPVIALLLLLAILSRVPLYSTNTQYRTHTLS